MSILAALRNKGFWILDAVKGGTVRKAYLDIRKIDGMDSDREEILRYREHCWERLKEHAVRTTDYYAGFENRKFREFPVISKNDIRAQQDRFLSSSYEKDSLFEMSTSGSTGTPFVCLQDAGKKKRVNAEIIYYSEKVGYRVGENLSYIRTVVRQVKKSGFKQFLQNQTLINCGHLDDEGLEEILDSLQRISRHGKVTLLGYGSTYTALKDYVRRKGIKTFPELNIGGVISGSDMLFDETREAVSKVLGDAPVVSRYSNEENGVLGQDEGINNVFPVNEADYIIEILDDEGRPVPEGSQGRIVVTDLFNYAMPMIRYDTGDVGAVRVFDINGRKKRCVCDFSGRRVDVITDSKGAPLSPYVITNYMWSFPDILQFQVIQKGLRDYVLRLNVPDSFGRETELLSLMRTLLGEDAVITVERVEEIPVLASGKRRYVVNEWRQ